MRPIHAFMELQIIIVIQYIPLAMVACITTRVCKVSSNAEYISAKLPYRLFKVLFIHSMYNIVLTLILCHLIIVL